MALAATRVIVRNLGAAASLVEFEHRKQKSGDSQDHDDDQPNPRGAESEGLFLLSARIGRDENKETKIGVVWPKADRPL